MTDGKIQTIGTFKGLVRVTDCNYLTNNAESNKEKEDHWNFVKKLTLKNEELVIRLYLLDGMNLAAKDEGSHSDP